MFNARLWEQLAGFTPHLNWLFLSSPFSQTLGCDILLPLLPGKSRWVWNLENLLRDEKQAIAKLLALKGAHSGLASLIHFLF